MDWVDCSSCSTEFKVVSDSDELIQYCPYCGSVVDPDPEEEPEDDDDY